MAKKNLPRDPELMVRVVGKLAAAALQNAGRHLASADAVLAHGEWPTAFSVAALGLEELGKASLCLTMLGMPPQVREEFRPLFNKAFTDHESKAVFAHFGLALISEEAPGSVDQMLADVVEAAKRTNSVKFRGLYVDFTEQGTLLNPTDVTETEARWIVTAGTDLLASMGPAAEALEDLDDFLEVTRTWQAGMDFEALGAQVEADPEAFLTAMRDVAKNRSDPPSYLLGGFAGQL